MLTGWPGVTWPHATRRLPSMVWNSRASWTGTAWRKRYWVEGEGGAADRIDSPDTGSVAEDRLEDEAQGEALLRQAFVLGRSQRCGEVVGAQLEKIGDKKEPASAGRGQPAGEQSGDIMRDVVAGDDTGARLAGPIEVVNLFLGEEPRREGRGYHLFFLARP